MPEPRQRILFVCLGNICRSPAAEGVFLQLLGAQDFDGMIGCDSAGTMDWHTGKRPDRRMREACKRRGITLTSRARQVARSDFDEFDLILAMDRDNYEDLERMKEQRETRAELKLFCEFCIDHDHDEVPDPYYGDEDGFEKVLDILEDGCGELLAQLEAKLLRG